jgi:N-methylhydantoinase A
MSGSSAPFRVGVDIGGTFTDLVFLQPDGTLAKFKVPSTPDDYSRAIVEGVTAWCAREGLATGRIAEIVHATTVATNAILERKGARTGLITTAGFRDVLELRRIRIPFSYDLGWEKPVPLVERELRLAVPERLDAAGNVLVPLDRDALGAAIDELAQAGVEAVAVCFLHAYRDASHERIAGEAIRRRMPGAYLSLSHEVLPEMLEFERTSTTVVNAYVGPLIARYLARLRTRFADEGVTAPLLVMQSNGGLVSAGAASDRPVTIIESGPAAGVVAAARLAADCGYPDVITLDMGGTTTKASIIEKGTVLRATEYEVGSPVSVSSRLMRGSGYLLRIPVIDVSEVGAGGGSIASLDSGGSMRVGPVSAGAVPGPACYGHGNDRPTVTDANLALGFLGVDSLAGGALTLHRPLAEAALRRHLGDPAGLSTLDAAWGVHVIANSNMVRAIKSVSVERGRDPADFVMMAFGGAGPMHAAGVAEELGIRKVLVPPAPGVFSAFGLLRAEVEHHSARTVLASTRDLDPARIDAAFGEMRADLLGRIAQEGFDADAVRFETGIDLRYRGQSSELTVPFPEGKATPATLRTAEERFEQEFERTYGHRGQAKEFELVTCRLVLTVARLAEHGASWRGDSAEELPMREVYFGAGRGLLRTRVLGRGALRGGGVPGPAIVQEYDTSVVVPPGWLARLDAHGNILLEAS